VLQQHEGIPSVHGPTAELEEGRICGMAGRVPTSHAPSTSRRNGSPSVQFSPVILCNFTPVLTRTAVRRRRRAQIDMAQRAEDR
jgi:hypothetical protein